VLYPPIILFVAKLYGLIYVKVSHSSIVGRWCTSYYVYIPEAIRLILVKEYISQRVGILQLT